jgi:putative endonuclease
MKPGWVYILKCSDGSFYTGSTSHLERRLDEHKTGLITGITSSRLPVKLVFSEQFDDIADAVVAERRIKGWRRAKKIALMNGECHLLPELARSYRSGEI